MTGALGSDRVRRSVLFGLFFLSGAAALVYQTAWHRLLGLFAGADTIAAALVVGAFLLGLGIGSLAAGPFGRSPVAPRRPFSLRPVRGRHRGLRRGQSLALLRRHLIASCCPLPSSRGVIFTVVFAGLLWPTFLMGCSLPFLSKAVVSEIAGSAKLIGWLYGLNTLGAGVGAFVGGWYLIGTFGFDKAVHVGAALNLVVALGGLLLARGLGMADTQDSLNSARIEGFRRRRCLALVAAGLHQRLPDRRPADRLVPPDRRAAAVQRLQLLAGAVGVPAGRCGRPAGRRPHHRPHRRSAALLSS